MRAPRLRFGPQDHVVIRGISRRWVEATAGGHVFERLDQPGVLETFTDADLAYDTIINDDPKSAAVVEAATPWDMLCTPETVVFDGGPSFIADDFEVEVCSILSSPQVSTARKPLVGDGA